MRSKANLKGHPVHPMLVAFPIAFFSGVLFLDTLHLFYPTDKFLSLAYLMEAAGILSALAAAIPGAIDFFYTIPPGSSAKKRGLKHGLLNVSMLSLFVISFIIRQSALVPHEAVVLAEAIAWILLLIAAWHGGTLTSRNQIGIDHRYAGAGKWNEKKIHSSSGKAELKGLQKLGLNQMLLFHVNGKRIAVSRTEKGFAAFADRCTHRGGPLADGVHICGTVQCPWHGSQFSTATGEVKAGPAREKINIYPIDETGGKYFLDSS